MARASLHWKQIVTPTPQFAVWTARIGMMVFFKLLEHQGRLSKLQPAPAYSAVAIGSPLLGHLKAQPIDIKTQRRFHIRHAKKWHGLPDVRFDFCFGWHFFPG